MKDFKFVVQCNGQPAIEINVVACCRDKAERYAKEMYAKQYTIYANDRYNNWLIMRRVDI
jgi:hypothetical protein